MLAQKLCWVQVVVRILQGDTVYSLRFRNQSWTPNTWYKTPEFRGFPQMKSILWVYSRFFGITKTKYKFTVDHRLLTFCNYLLFISFPISPFCTLYKCEKHFIKLSFTVPNFTWCFRNRCVIQTHQKWW